MTEIDLIKLDAMARAGESETVEFKKSTAQLPRAGESLCGMLNGKGGIIIIGVDPNGEIVGQQVADSTQQELARMLDRFEPPAPIEHCILPIASSRNSVIVFEAPRVADASPFTYDGRPYQRVGTTTSRMPQERYEQLLLQRCHVHRRWENQVAVGVRVQDLDHEEILRTREAGIQSRRISAGTSMDIGDILDRLGLRHDGELTQAAQIFYGTRFLPDYPQGHLKLGRFRGTKITGDILDNKQEYMHAFKIVREAMAFLDRTLPLSGHFVEGRIEREDRLAIPPQALREVILNAVMHGDYSNPGGDVVVTFTAQIGPKGDLVPDWDQVGTKLALSRHQVSILEKCQEETGIVSLMGMAGRTDRTKFRDQVLTGLLDAALLELTIPDKPNSSKQQYRITALGKRVLEQRKQQ